ncbi:hypothetical protein N8964_00715 [Pontimonas sp.]|nr:hypothetical protein [Pontimonas sp.]
MTTIVLGSKPITTITDVPTTVIAANGAFSQLTMIPSTYTRLLGVFTPYLFSPILPGTPYEGRESLFHATLEAVRRCPPQTAFIRPGATSEAGAVLSAAKDFFPSGTEIRLLSRITLSWDIMKFSGMSPASRALRMVRDRAKGYYPVSDPRFKISTGVMGALIALAANEGFESPIHIHGIGTTEDAYSYLSSVRADRAPHVSADIQFLKSVRAFFPQRQILVSDSVLENATRP